MRRVEFICDDLDLTKRHFDEIPFGVMIIGDSPLPYAIPLSFCFLPNIAQKGAIGIHGAKAGRKFALLKDSPKVGFSAVKPYSYIGSEFLGGRMIPTQFFFSAMIVGDFCVVDDLAKKREILSALVAKYEPQSSNFSFDKKAFMGSENGVFVGFIEIQSISVKAKFGQNLKDSDFESIMSDLAIRATDIDLQTIVLMKHFRV